MASFVFISDWTWRSKEQQRETIYSKFPELINVPEFVGELDKPVMFRPTTRSVPVTIYVASIATFGSGEGDLYVSLQGMKVRGHSLFSVEENKLWKSSVKWDCFLEAWKEARKHNAGKIGARRSADKKISVTKEAIELIRDDWPKPSKEYPTEALKKRSGLSLNTIKAHLGKRPIAQYNYQAKLKRKAAKDAKR